MAYEKIYNGYDAYVQHSVTFPTGLDWTDYTYVHIIMKHKSSGTVLQTNGYPTGEGNIDLVVPDTSAGTCYFKIDQESIDGYTGAIEWILTARETDSDFSDSTYDPGDKITKFTLV